MDSICNLHVNNNRRKRRRARRRRRRRSAAHQNVLNYRWRFFFSNCPTVMIKLWILSSPEAPSLRIHSGHPLGHMATLYQSRARGVSPRSLPGNRTLHWTSQLLFLSVGLIPGHFYIFWPVWLHWNTHQSSFRCASRFLLPFWYPSADTPCGPRKKPR